MDSYTIAKCVQNNCLPSLYVDESSVKTLRQALTEINIEITQMDDELITTVDKTDADVKLVHITGSDTKNIKSLCLNTFKSQMKLNFAQPWHQSWFKNVPKSDPVDLQNLDIFDLISHQIENHRLVGQIAKLIESKLNMAVDTFDLNKYLFDTNRDTVGEEILLHFLYHYGRHHYTKVIWLEDITGTDLFDACISEMNLKIINLRYVQIQLDDYDDMYEVIQRLNVSNQQFTIKVGTKFSTMLFQNLIACNTVEEIHIDVGFDGRYYSSHDNYKLDVDEFAGRSDDHKTIRVQNTGLESNDGIGKFLEYFKWFCNSGGQQTRHFYLTLDAVLIDDWSILNGLNLLEITFKNVEITVEHLKQLAACTKLYTNLKFIDCPNFGDEMLLKFLEICDWMRSLHIMGRSAITMEFFKQYARTQILRRDLMFYDFAEENITFEVEGFERCTSSGIFTMDDFIEY